MGFIVEVFSLKVLLVLVGLVLAVARLCIAFLKIPTILGLSGLRSLPKFIFVFSASLNIINLLFLIIGIPVLVVAVVELSFGDFLIYAALQLQFVGEVEVNCKQEVAGPENPDKEIAERFTSELLASLDKNASDFWTSMRPYFLAYVARGPAARSSSLKTFEEQYFWSKISAHWEQNGAWLDLESPEIWTRRVNACRLTYGWNESVEDAQICKGIIHYVKNSLADRFSVAAMKGDSAVVGNNPFKHFLWEFFEHMIAQRKLIEKDGVQNELEVVERRDLSGHGQVKLCLDEIASTKSDHKVDGAQLQEQAVGTLLGARFPFACQTSKAKEELDHIANQHVLDDAASGEVDPGESKQLDEAKLTFFSMVFCDRSNGGPKLMCMDPSQPQMEMPIIPVEPSDLATQALRDSEEDWASNVPSALVDFDIEMGVAPEALLLREVLVVDEPQSIEIDSTGKTLCCW